MKKIILSLMAGAVLFTSCDLLNNDPDDSFTKGNFFTSETNVEMYTNYFYAEWSGYGNSSSYGDFYFPTLNDNQAVSGLSTWNQTSVPASDGTWEACYEEIRRANILLEEVGNVDMAPSSMAYYKSLAHLYRGWQHFCLVRKFGDCYWVDKTLGKADEDILYGPRHNRNIVMDNILADLQYAVDSMGSKNADSRTAYNVHVANAIKSHVCLFEGTYAKYHLKDNARAEKYLKEAITASEAIIKAGQFALTPGAEGYRANYNSIELAGNTEMIMYKRYELGILGHATQDYCCSTTPTNGMSKSAFNAYLMADGSLPTGDDKGEMIKTEDDTYMSIQKLLDARDPRLAHHVDADLRFGGSPRIRYQGEPGQEAALPNFSTTGYGVLKFDESGTQATQRQSIGTNHTDAPIFWLAEILLNHAEACAELNKTAEAKESLNKLRARVGMPDYNAPLNDPANNAAELNGGTEVSDLVWEVRRERRVEMMYDKNDRYWSLIRWRELERLDTRKYEDQTLGAWVDSNFPYDAESVTLNKDGYISCKIKTERIFDNKYYLAPIPSDQQFPESQIGQNPGW